MSIAIDLQHLPPIVSAEWLAQHGTEVVVADVRWYLDGRSGRAEFERSHLEDAVFVDLDVDLSDKSQPATMGRHPLPSPEAFAAAMTRLGIGDRTPVVAYDDTGGSTAGRLVVMLRALGRSAALLDGGMAAWTGPLTTGAGWPATPSPFTAQPWPTDRFATVADVEPIAAGTAPAGVVLLDARAPERYRGEVEPIDPKAGHIPAARNAPWNQNLDPSTGRFRTPAELRAVYAAAGIGETTPVICSCGSGVTACADVLGLERAGFAPPRLFVPSWSGWCNDPSRPVGTGNA